MCRGVDAPMGIDNYNSDDKDDSISDELQEELSKNTPPGNSNSWKEHEPGQLEWANLIESGTENIEGSSEGTTEVLIIQVQGVDSSKVASPHFVDTEEYC